MQRQAAVAQTAVEDGAGTTGCQCPDTPHHDGLDSDHDSVESLYFERTMGKLTIGGDGTQARGIGIALFPSMTRGIFEVYIEFTSDRPHQAVGVAKSSRVQSANPTAVVAGLRHADVRGWGIQATGQVINGGCVVDTKRFDFVADGVTMILDLTSNCLHVKTGRQHVAFRGVHGPVTPLLFVEDGDALIKARHSANPSKKTLSRS